MPDSSQGVALIGTIITLLGLIILRLADSTPLTLVACLITLAGAVTVIASAVGPESS